jgi:hypothetical protein
MLVFGLVHDGEWEPPEHGWDSPDDEPPEHRPWTWRLPWRPLAWFAAWCWLMALVPVVNSAFGGLAGYGVLMLALAPTGTACANTSTSARPAKPRPAKPRPAKAGEKSEPGVRFLEQAPIERSGVNRRSARQ